MSQPKDMEKGDQHDPGKPHEIFPIEIDEGGLTGLSALLTFAPSVPFMHNNNERRTGQDRRTTDRRVTAREFRVSE